VRLEGCVYRFNRRCARAIDLIRKIVLLSGNTHRMMMDVNNLHVPDGILSCVEKNVSKKPAAVCKK
jgi:hypothetical protein